MERMLKWLDECDDLVAALRLHARPVVVTVLLLVAFLAVIGAIFAFGAPELLAAP